MCDGGLSVFIPTPTVRRMVVQPGEQLPGELLRVAVDEGGAFTTPYCTGVSMPSMGDSR